MDVAVEPLGGVEIRPAACTWTVYGQDTLPKLFRHAVAERVTR